MFFCFLAVQEYKKLVLIFFPTETITAYKIDPTTQVVVLNQ